VKRELDPDDSRRIKVTLKSAGQAKLKGIAWSHLDSKEKRFQPSSCFTRQEKEQLTKLLVKLNQHLKQIKEDTYG
jgi:DNA-binding MarR family transcriptional regulator